MRVSLGMFLLSFLVLIASWATFGVPGVVIVTVIMALLSIMA